MSLLGIGKVLSMSILPKQSSLLLKASAAIISGRHLGLLSPSEHPMKQLYPSHVPTTTFQKGLLSLGSALVGVIEPTRGDMIATLGEATGAFALQRLRDRMASDPIGAQILRERPLITEDSVNVSLLRTYPDGSFGREYVRFLDNQKVSPNTRSEVRFVDDEELAYVIQRYRQIHDFVHTLLDLPISVEAEIAVKWFEMLQTGLPMTIAGSLFGPLHLSLPEVARLGHTYIPWALRCGMKSEFLLNIFFENHFSEPIEELRNRLHIEPAPKM